MARNAGREVPGAASQELKTTEFEMRMILRFARDDSGATAIEYGLIAAAMGFALITAMPYLQQAITGKFIELADEINNSMQ